MSGAAVPVGRGAESPAPARRERAWLPGAGAAAARPVARPALAIELPLFAALAVLGMSQWARLVAPSSAGRLALALTVVCAVAALLWALSFLRARRLRFVLALTVSVGGVIGALVAAGLPLHLAAPAEWGELRHELRSGIGGIEEAQLPYGGNDPWIRLTLTLGAPALVAVAAALAFWPATRRGGLRVAALGLLLITYGVGATLDNPGAEAFWGIVLLLFSVAWLWIPGLAWGRRGRAIAVAAAAGLLTLPLVARLNGPAWWDYENWSWFGAERTVRFEWNHSYGPLDWPRDGTTLMTVETDTPLYWKASVLDRFDGYRWERPAPGDDDRGRRACCPRNRSRSRARAPAPGLGSSRPVRAPRADQRPRDRRRADRRDRWPRGHAGQSRRHPHACRRPARAG